MELSQVVRLVSEAFGKAQVPFLLVGGFAVNYYKFSRRTIDIDFLTTEEGYEKARSFLEKGGYKEFRRTPLVVRLRKDEAGSIDVDILFVDKKTLDGLLREAGETELLGIRLKTPSLNHLIAMKLHAIKQDQEENREFRDLRDIIEMVKINHVDVRTSDFRNLCLKFGTEEIYQMILKATAKWKI